MKRDRPFSSSDNFNINYSNNLIAQGMISNTMDLMCSNVSGYLISAYSMLNERHCIELIQ